MNIRLSRTNILRLSAGLVDTATLLREVDPAAVQMSAEDLAERDELVRLGWLVAKHDGSFTATEAAHKLLDREAAK